MNPRAIQMYREHNTQLWGKGKAFNQDDMESAFSDKSTIFNSIDDGISILDKDLHIQSVNFTFRTWYPDERNFSGKKCFNVYHGRSEPCEDCPILLTLADGEAHRAIITYHIKSINAIGWHELQSFPIYSGNEIVGVVEYVKDITYELDLYSKIYDIEHKMEHFKEQNELLKMYLSQLDEEKNEIESSITGNIQKYVKPLIKQIKESAEDRPVEYDLVSFLETLLQNITAPYMDDSALLEDFTAREIQILSLIKGGKTTKEISEVMHLSTKTVDFHRANIRKKLGLERGDNLRSHIMKSRMPIE